MGPIVTGLELIPREDSLEKDIVVYVRETIMKPLSVGSMVGVEGKILPIGRHGECETIWEL